MNGFGSRSLWLLLLLLTSCTQASEAAWERLRQGQAVLLLRHATAPGLGDPPGFQVGDCSTQRNLDATGKAEATRWGERLRARGIDDARLFSSRWCRALDTAQGLQLGEVQTLTALDSFFSAPERKQAQTRALRRFINQLPSGPPLVLVSHQVNITALTGLFPRSGEGLILALPLGEPVEVLARVPPP